MNDGRKWLLSVSTLAALLAWATPAMAHPGHGPQEFVDGWVHPFTGLDHLLAMVAVGLLAVRVGGKAIWIMPSTFMGGMILGGILAECGVPMPGVELGIAASVLVLGLLVAVTEVISLRYGALMVSLFAVFHGHAHATEMARGSSMVAYACGFLLATALLHACGITAGLAMAKWLDSKAIRLSGGIISATGLLLLVGLL